ncbi:hypothetical protein AVEN_190248-1 [Araneus ventricosus]|uniref:Uncharacterized protein n=1 Tax=Araneus ventricosus TaxID=182803 RepID=A0A4Y2M2G3_ARAVE|nr:hypothetical protein AVEN_190248-1 [Araneus ventricosus]
MEDSQGITELLIPKEGKNLSRFQSYRPICLLPVREKILDKLITNRLVTYLEENCLLSECQHDFCKGRGTTTALNKITEFITKARYKVPYKIAGLINAFLSDRTILLSRDEPWKYNVGVPQGLSCPSALAVGDQ